MPDQVADYRSGVLVVCVGVIDKPSWRLDLVHTISQRVLAAGRSRPLEALSCGSRSLIRMRRTGSFE